MTKLFYVPAVLIVTAGDENDADCVVERLLDAVRSQT